MIALSLDSPLRRKPTKSRVFNSRFHFFPFSGDLKKTFLRARFRKVSPMFCDKLVVGFALHRIRNRDLEVHQSTLRSHPFSFSAKWRNFLSGIFAVA